MIFGGGACGAVLIAFWGQAARFILQTATTVILARLLTPDDYGLVAMVTIVVVFAQTFRDAGLSAATIRHEHIAREPINSLFWVNLGIDPRGAAPASSPACSRGLLQGRPLGRTQALRGRP